MQRQCETDFRNSPGPCFQADFSASLKILPFDRQNKPKLTPHQQAEAIKQAGQGRDVDGHCPQLQRQPHDDFEVDGRNMSGVLITRGMTVAIPAGGFTLSIGDDGKLSSSVTVHVHL